MAAKKHAKPVRKAKKLGKVKPLSARQMLSVQTLSDKSQIF